MNKYYKIKKYKQFFIAILILIIMSIPQPCNQETELRTWVLIAKQFNTPFFDKSEARKIGSNCIKYQNKDGGFPKNYFVPDEMSTHLINRIKNHKKSPFYTTLDNDATTTEIIYLSKLYTQNKREKYKKAALKGIHFLINSQYENGGFAQSPQIIKPNNKKQRDKNIPIHYQRQITYNDNAMLNAIKLLDQVSKRKYPFEYVDNDTAQKAKIAAEKGINCILKTQIKQNGKLTAWSQHYDYETLEPISGRNYEKNAITAGKESTNIVLYLMSIENPSEEIKNSVESAIEWFKKSKINNIEVKYFINKEGIRDAKLVRCNSCAPIWARYYSIENNKPFFTNRDKSVVLKFDKIDPERRPNYEWFGYYPQEALDKYQTWIYRKQK